LKGIKQEKFFFFAGGGNVTGELDSPFLRRRGEQETVVEKVEKITQGEDVGKCAFFPSRRTSSPQLFRGKRQS